MEVLITKLLEYGTTPALLVLSFMVGALLVKLDKNAKADAERAAELRQELACLAADTRTRQKDMSDRIAAVERDYTKLERHYQDVGGWNTSLAELRTEIREGNKANQAQISDMYGQIIKVVVEGIKNGVKG